MNEKVKRVSLEDCAQDGEITLFEDKPFTGVVFLRYEKKKQKAWKQEFKDGIPHGLRTDWDENGRKTLEEYYNNGQVEGLATSWYENGDVFLCHYKNGKLEGLATGWHKEDKGFRPGMQIKSSEGLYKDGKREGLWTEWYDINGKKKVEKHYKNGKENGLWTEWDYEGKKTFQGTFKDGNEE